MGSAIECSVRPVGDPLPGASFRAAVSIPTRPSAPPLAGDFFLPAAHLQPICREISPPPTSADRQPMLFLPPAYLVVLATAEVLGSLAAPVAPLLPPAFFVAVLLLLLLHAVLGRDRPWCCIPLILVAAPACRLLLFLLPFGTALFPRCLALGLPSLLAAFVATHSLHLVPGWDDLVRRVGKLWGESVDLLRSGLISFQKRTCPYGFWILTLPTLTLLLAVISGILIARSCSGSVVAWAGLPSGAASARAVRGGERPDTAASAEEQGPWAAIGRGMQQDVRPARVPAPLQLRSEAKRPRLLAAVVFWPRRAASPLAAGQPVARIPIGDDVALPAGRQSPFGPDDALRPTLAPRPKPTPVPLTTAFPGCPSLGYGNPYPRGVCTWYAKERRPDLPGFWGDYGLAVNWPDAAAACGFRVDGRPAAGAVIVFPPGANGAYEGGHVAYVEAVEEQALLISECNVDHGSAGIVEPRWWEAGYACAFRRIPWSRLDSRVRYIHRY